MPCRAWGNIKDGRVRKGPASSDSFFFLSFSLSLNLPPWLSSSHSRTLALSLTLSLSLAQLSSSFASRESSALFTPFVTSLSTEPPLSITRSSFSLPPPLQLLGSCSFSFLKYPRLSPTRPVRQPAFLSSPPYTLHHQRQHTHPHALRQKKHYPLIPYPYSFHHRSSLDTFPHTIASIVSSRTWTKRPK
ncbi:MAG: hypothetical protein J3Q66DRAFT_79260 [Benniella sp.]|nr:MAG: hypothetical protein J3Q66DRAFT_79260 [Benniella sp.]